MTEFSEQFLVNSPFKLPVTSLYVFYFYLFFTTNNAEFNQLIKLLP